MSECIWKSPPDNIEIHEGEVHVWCADVGQPKRTLERLEVLLSTYERERVSQIKEPTNKARFITSRGVLRVLLGKYLTVAPEKLLFDYNPQGKPFLKFVTSLGEINFNISHSGKIIIYGFVLNSEIGVDVEELRSIRELDNLAKGVFTAREFSNYLKFPIEQRRRAFFRGWTKKEAFTKGLGEGLMLPFNSIEVSLGAGNLPVLLEKFDHPSKVDGWRLELLEPAVNYVGALAVRKEKMSINKWHLEIDHISRFSERS